MDKVHSIEHSLFAEWTRWLQENKPEHGFTYDGVICRESWNDVNKHVLFLLKDVNDASDSFNLRYYILNGVFKAKHNDVLTGKHVLIVDDVMTTSATLTACADALREIEGIRFSLLTLAISNQL